MVQVYYDKNCRLCSKAIDKLRSYNSNMNIDFYDSAEIKKIAKIEDLKYIEKTDSLIFIENSSIKFYSEAIIYLFKLTGGVYKILAILLSLIPLYFRDQVYKLISRNRYRITSRIIK